MEKIEIITALVGGISALYTLAILRGRASTK